MTIETETETGRTAHLLALMKSGDDAFNSRDFAKMATAHHPDLVAHVAGSAEPIRGQEAHAGAMSQMFEIFPDVHVENDPYPIQFGSGEWTTVISPITGTFLGAMTLPDGQVIQPTGKAFHLDFCTVARWEGDVLVEEWAIWDSALQNQQIGLG